MTTTIRFKHQRVEEKKWSGVRFGYFGNDEPDPKTRQKSIRPNTARATVWNALDLCFYVVEWLHLSDWSALRQTFKYFGDVLEEAYLPLVLDCHDGNLFEGGSTPVARARRLRNVRHVLSVYQRVRNEEAGPTGFGHLMTVLYRLDCWPLNRYVARTHAPTMIRRMACLDGDWGIDDGDRWLRMCCQQGKVEALVAGWTALHQVTPFRKDRVYRLLHEAIIWGVVGVVEFLLSKLRKNDHCDACVSNCFEHCAASNELEMMRLIHDKWSLTAHAYAGALAAASSASTRLATRQWLVQCTQDSFRRTNDHDISHYLDMIRLNAVMDHHHKQLTPALATTAEEGSLLDRVSNIRLVWTTWPTTSADAVPALSRACAKSQYATVAYLSRQIREQGTLPLETWRNLLLVYLQDTLQDTKVVRQIFPASSDEPDDKYDGPRTIMDLLRRQHPDIITGDDSGDLLTQAVVVDSRFPNADDASVDDDEDHNQPWPERTDCLQWMLDHKAVPNVQQSAALMTACRLGNLPAMKLLIGAKCDVFAQHHKALALTELVGHLPGRLFLLHHCGVNFNITAPPVARLLRDFGDDRVVRHGSSRIDFPSLQRTAYDPITHNALRLRRRWRLWKASENHCQCDRHPCEQRNWNVLSDTEEEEDEEYGNGE